MRLEGMITEMNGSMSADASRRETLDSNAMVCDGAGRDWIESDFQLDFLTYDQRVPVFSTVSTSITDCSHVLEDPWTSGFTMMLSMCSPWDEDEEEEEEEEEEDLDEDEDEDEEDEEDDFLDDEEEEEEFEEFDEDEDEDLDDLDEED